MSELLCKTYSTLFKPHSDAKILFRWEIYKIHKAIGGNVTISFYAVMYTNLVLLYSHQSL